MNAPGGRRESGAGTPEGGSTLPAIEDLPAEAATPAARLVGVGVHSGAVVVGLSRTRRTGDLALVFFDAGVSANTQRELGHLVGRGVRVLRCADLTALTAVLGRQDASVLAVRRGPLARGMADLLPAPRT